MNPGLKNGFSLHSQGSAWTSGGLGSEGMVGYGFGRSGHGALTETALSSYKVKGHKYLKLILIIIHLLVITYYVRVK